MKAEAGTNMIVRSRDGKEVACPFCVTATVKGGTIQVHEFPNGEWEAWFVPSNDLFPSCCIASSTNLPDRHYDE